MEPAGTLNSARNLAGTGSASVHEPGMGFSPYQRTNAAGATPAPILPRLLFAPVSEHVSVVRLAKQSCSLQNHGINEEVETCWRAAASSRAADDGNCVMVP